MECKKFGTEPEPHKAVDTGNFLTQMDQRDFEPIGTGHCLIQQDKQGFE